jgi:hypothetical protein
MSRLFGPDAVVELDSGQDAGGQDAGEDAAALQDSTSRSIRAVRETCCRAAQDLLEMVKSKRHREHANAPRRTHDASLSRWTYRSRPRRRHGRPLLAGLAPRRECGVGRNATCWAENPSILTYYVVSHSGVVAYSDSNWFWHHLS